MVHQKIVTWQPWVQSHLCQVEVAFFKYNPYKWLYPRKGMIIKCPLYELFHDVVTLIIMSQMVVSKVFLTVDVI